jgi:hypothetical protein
MVRFTIFTIFTEPSVADPAWLVPLYMQTDLDNKGVALTNGSELLKVALKKLQTDLAEEQGRIKERNKLYRQTTAVPQKGNKIV